jgi:hypothetical protein
MRRLQLKKYLDLPQKGKIMAEYVWIDGSNGLRSKSKVSLFSPPTFLHDALRHLRHPRKWTSLACNLRLLSLGEQLAAIHLAIHTLDGGCERLESRACWSAV